jgi:hypothetical protein
MTTTITELLQSANALLFDSEGARYPDDDLATMTVWTPRAFSASDNMAGGLDCALSATAEQSEPRTPFAWVDYERTLREGETQVRVWVEEDGDAQAQEEAEYTCRPEATPRAPPSPIRDYAVADPAPAPAVDEAEAAPAEAMEAEAEAAPAAEEAAPIAPPKQKKVRVYFSGRRMWGGAVPSKRARSAAKKAPKPLRVKLPMGEDATLARGALVAGMAGSTAEERRRLIEVARELRKGPGGWADAIEETLNRLFVPAGAQLMSFGNGADDNMDLRCTGKNVARNAERIMDALDHLRAPENAVAAAERGVLVNWPECLPPPLLRCAELHEYLDAWRAGVEYVRGAY